MDAATKTPVTQALCRHCQTPFHPTNWRPDFCCAGCQFVHELIKQQGLGQFYDLQEGGLPPVKSTVFAQRDFSWLTELVTKAEAKAERCELTLDVQGLSCLGCVWLIEKVAARTPGVISLRVDPTLGRGHLRWERGTCDVLALARRLQSFGYLLGPPGSKPLKVTRALTLRLGICGALAMNTMLFTLPSYLGMEAGFAFAALFEKINLVLGTLSLLIGGSYFFARSWRGLRQGILHIDLPISLGVIAAYVASVYAWAVRAPGFIYFDFVSIFVFLMLVGRWLQQRAVERNRSRLLSAFHEPTPVELPETGERLPVAELTHGVAYLIAPGQPIPVRSKLRSPAATLSLEWINGESEATTARRGRIVPSGAIYCGQQSVEFEALEPWAQSQLYQLIRAVPDTPPRNAALERFIGRYLIAVLVVAGLGGAMWWSATGDVLRSLQVLVSVLVVSCPCASGVALPLADDLAAATLRKLGVFVRETSLWSRLTQVRKVLFDKTGTLTLETMALRNPEMLAALLPAEKRALLAMVNHNLHPVSCCLRESLLAEGVGEADLPEPEEHVGLGLELHATESVWRLGRPGWAGEAEGETVFSRNGEVIAVFLFGDDLRHDAPAEIDALTARGCEVFILSGDRRAKVASMSVRLGVPRRHCFGEMTPEDKAAWVRHHDAHDTLLIGDGANDSLAFNAAWCTGTPAVDRGLLEHKAGFYFLGRHLGGVRALLEMAFVRRSAVRRVVGFAIAYNTFAVLLALTGHMSPLLAAILMPASSLVSLAIVTLRMGRFSSASFQR